MDNDVALPLKGGRTAAWRHGRNASAEAACQREVAWPTACPASRARSLESACCFGKFMPCRRGATAGQLVATCGLGSALRVRANYHTPGAQLLLASRLRHHAVSPSTHEGTQVLELG